jgi:hypothetical protein
MIDIKRTNISRKERGLPEHSYFKCELRNGKRHHEDDVSWNDISKEKQVQYGNIKKFVRTCNHVKHLEVNHAGMKAEIDADKDEEIYQSVKAMTTFYPGGESKTDILGRILGKIKDGKVIEEIFINEKSGEVQGFKL